MKLVLGFCLLFYAVKSYSNMASPVQRGTAGTISFLHSNVNILEENIYIKPTADFSNAFFVIRYNIEALQNGKNIPMLFHAIRYDSGFIVKVDGVPVSISKIPADFLSNQNKSQGFENYFTGNKDSYSRVKIPWTNNYTEVVDLKDLLFFEIELTKGAHQIEVQYMARTWVDRSEWVKTYTMPYALTAARFWKNFGKLHITIDGSAFGKNLNTNFGKPVSGSNNGLTRWEFDSIPKDVISIVYEPVISPKAAKLLRFGPENMAIVFTVVFALLHGFWIFQNRKKNKSKKASSAFWWGTILVPFFVLIFYMYSFSIIDQVIGVEASQRHGYTFLSIIFYPFLLIGYGLIMYFVDYYFKKK